MREFRWEIWGEIEGVSPNPNKAECVISACPPPTIYVWVPGYVEVQILKKQAIASNGLWARPHRKQSST